MNGLRVPLRAAAVQTALGDDLATTLRALQRGESAAAALDAATAAAFGSQRVARLPIDPEAGEDDPTLRILGQHGQVLERVVHAVHEAGAGASVARTRMGFYLGLAMVDSPLPDLVPPTVASRDSEGRFDRKRFFAGGYRHLHPLWPLSMLGNVAACQISTDLDIRGDNVVFASDAIGGVRAVLEAARAVDEGIVDAALAAGAAPSRSVLDLERARLEAAPQSRVRGEGGAALLLGAGTPKPLGWIRGGATATGPEALARASARALREAGWHAADIETLPMSADDLRERLGHLGAAQALIEVALAIAPGRGDHPRAILITVEGARSNAGALAVERA